MTNRIKSQNDEYTCFQRMIDVNISGGKREIRKMRNKENVAISKSDYTNNSYILSELLFITTYYCF